ncbi:XylR N-terminal domain-containing protein [Bacillus norwichensis]|uniref:XylR N-terminal domain-containing protein n=1 Tax=Bacillus norwichensis TaxID=2762217 RepID=A0ABR8VG29_9BACI|nr:XylR N-terminal domain-containing protein [Bacillus norwichensis]MBD8003733.1 XylR N-terminal domain-containing protein [Bacillus norwichensis]
MIINVSGESDSTQNQQKDRTIHIYSSAFGILRKELIKNIGMKRMKGFLLRYGWEMGISDAEKEMASDSSLESLLKKGPVYHHLNGYINSIIYEADFELNHDQTIKSVKGKGTWIGSYEAEEHIKHLTVSDTPVCYINIGYLNGYLTTICNHTVIAKEVSCVGMGDEKCTWIVKSQEFWEDDIQDELQYYYQTPIVKELEYTYEQLLDQRNHITKVSYIHKRLTEEIINGNDLQSIVKVVHEISENPCMIHDANFRPLAYSGLTEIEYLRLEMDFNEYVQQNELFKDTGFELSSLETNIVLGTNLQERLIIPVMVRKEIVGYCTFIYSQGKNKYQENDEMILERVANAISLFLLNEKTSFESFERMKGNFLEQLLNEQYLSRKEILKRGTYVNIDLGQPFHIIALGYINRQADDMNEEFLLHEQILEATFVYFKEIKRNVLIGQREGNFVFLVNKADNVQNHTLELFADFLRYLESSFEKCEFKVGISTEGKQIESAPQHYDEALLALRMTTTKQVISFDDLGIVGVLINSSNASAVKSMANLMLGSMYENASQNDKLIKTLYVFLSNGGRLEQTMRDLSLSMSGLLYRINKIEAAIQKDLRNPEDSHQLFLILEALIALGELKIE